MPNELTTPPVMKMYFAITAFPREMFCAAYRAVGGENKTDSRIGHNHFRKAARRKLPRAALARVFQRLESEPIGSSKAWTN
ncbi:MAG: hypothetical protein NTY53_26305 [Kiritimatiellaeota bacterium]|nr:hypothetical protein [Kiritimatiellota bacterium]